MAATEVTMVAAEDEDEGEVDDKRSVNESYF